MSCIHVLRINPPFNSTIAKHNPFQLVENAVAITPLVPGATSLSTHQHQSTSINQSHGSNGQVTRPSPARAPNGHGPGWHRPARGRSGPDAPSNERQGAAPGEGGYLKLMSIIQHVNDSNNDSIYRC